VGADCAASKGLHKIDMSTALQTIGAHIGLESLRAEV
jgi:hypothetical protein